PRRRLAVELVAAEVHELRQPGGEPAEVDVRRGPERLGRALGVDRDEVRLADELVEDRQVPRRDAAAELDRQRLLPRDVLPVAGGLEGGAVNLAVPGGTGRGGAAGPLGGQPALADGGARADAEQPREQGRHLREIDVGFETDAGVVEELVERGGGGERPRG